MKIALVKHGKGDTLANWYSWCDGLYGAMAKLGETHKVQIYGYSDQTAFIKRDNLEINVFENEQSFRFRLDGFKPSVVFGWGTSFHNWNEIERLTTPKKRILLYAGGPIDKTNAFRHFDHVVVENESDKEKFEDGRVSVAFGTNTDVFKPMQLNKLYPSFYPAAFALYKRHNLWSESVPEGSLAVGHMQDHETECFETCIEKTHLVLPAVEMTTIPYLYNQSKATVLTAENMGGCQRSALESMACNVPVLVTSDSKASEFEGVWSAPADRDNLREAYLAMVTSFELEPVDLRNEYIVGKYDHIEYAKKLEALL